MSSTTTFKPARSGLNVRVILFIALVSAPFVWMAYAGTRYLFNGGIEDKGEYKLVDLKALGNFNFDSANGTTQDVPVIFRKLDGQKVALDGFMFSQYSAAQLSDFQFVYNIQKCCFNGPPLVQERVFVHVPNNKRLLYVDRYLRMIGTLHVQVKKEDGQITSVFTMEVERAETPKA